MRILVLLWKFGAKTKAGCITKAEFVCGMDLNGIADEGKLCSSLPLFDPGFLDLAEFRDFFAFVFQFSREGTNKTLGE